MINKLKGLKESKAALVFLLFAAVPMIPLLFSLMYERQREEDFIFILINAAILLFPLYFLKRFKSYVLLVSFFLFVPALLELCHVFLFQGRMTPSIFFVLFDTNPAETSEFLADFFSWELVAVATAYISLCITLIVKVLKIQDVKFKTKVWLYVLLWIIIPFGVKAMQAKESDKSPFEAHIRSNHFLSIMQSYSKYEIQLQRYKNFTNAIQALKKVERVKEFNGQETHVLILGESLSTFHMQLYGYSRETTPELVNMKNELTVFNDVMCTYPPGTLANLNKILTFSDTDSPMELKPNILQVMKRAGFKTYWISNQITVSKHDTMTTVVARQADKSYFLNTTNASSFDEKVLPIYDKVLNESVEKKFIVVHLIGSHMRYDFRYPSKFKKFDGKEGLKIESFHSKKKIEKMNHFDNSVYYNDFIVSEIFKKLKKQNLYSTALYVSDHGEVVYNGVNAKGHPHNLKDPVLYRVPFIIWSSKSFQMENQRELGDDILNRKYLSEDTIHTMLELYGIETEFSDNRKSVLNSNFVEKKRYGDFN